jgi:hypothetical protein
MMTDKELLELAAKAAGYTVAYHERVGGNYMVVKELNSARWNPLTDDGDALRLVVKLGLDILVTPNGETTVMGPFLQDDGQDYGIHEVVQHESDPYAATRRAIVRAAAEIGRSMK